MQFTGRYIIFRRKYVPMIRKVLTAVLVVLITCQTNSQSLDSARALMAREQYLSALDALDQVKEINVAGIHLLSTLVLDHHSGVNKDYNKFALEDKIKGGNGERMEIDLPMEKILWQGIVSYPDSCIIYQDLSKFYHLFISSEDRYLELDILKNIESALRTKINTKCPSYLTNYIIGYCNNYLGSADYGINFLKKSIELNRNFAPAYLELATACVLTKDPKNAAAYANKAFALSSKKSDKSKAALVLGEAYEAMNSNASAIQNYMLADSLNRRDFFINKAIVNFYVRIGDLNKAAEASDNFLGLNGRKNLYEYVDLFQIYSSHKKEKELARFCEERLVTYKDRSNVLGCLNFTLGKLCQKTDPSRARQYFTKAKELYGSDFSRYPNTRNHPDMEEVVKSAYQ